MTPRIRIGLIGLSTTSTSTNWAGTAHLPYLQSPQGQKLFEIVALCNSSKSSAEKSIKHYNLSSSSSSQPIKVYDSASEFAQDENIDLVVNVTGVERHYELVLPAVKAGKNVYTELPLASNMDQMQELMRAAEETKVKTVFGMQGQTSPVTLLIKQTIAQGKIGEVLSTTWVGAAGMFGEKPFPVGHKAFLFRETGANLMSVVFLHTFNYILATLGDIATYTSMLGNQRPSVSLMDPSQSSTSIIDTIKKNTPDQVLLQGRLASGALISYHLRGGDAFPGQPGVTWTIYGEKGELRITNPACMMDISHGGVKIELHVFGEDGKEKQELTLPEDELSDLQHPAQNVGRVYEEYAKGNAGGEDGYPDWTAGFQRHRLMEEMWKRSDEEGVWSGIS